MLATMQSRDRACIRLASVTSLHDHLRFLGKVGGRRGRCSVYHRSWYTRMQSLRAEPQDSAVSKNNNPLHSADTYLLFYSNGAEVIGKLFSQTYITSIYRPLYLSNC